MFDSISKTRICIGSSCQAPLNTILLSTFWNIHFHPILPQHLPLLHIPFSHYLYTTFVTNSLLFYSCKTLISLRPPLYSHIFCHPTYFFPTGFSLLINLSFPLHVSPHSTSFPTLSFPTALFPLTRAHLPFPFTGVNTRRRCCQQLSVTGLGW